MQAVRLPSNKMLSQSAALNPADITPLWRDDNGFIAQGIDDDYKTFADTNVNDDDIDDRERRADQLISAFNGTFSKGLNPEAFEEVVKLLTDSLPHLKELMEWWDRESESFEDNEKQMCKNIAGDIREFIHRSKSALQKAKL